MGVNRNPPSIRSARHLIRWCCGPLRCLLPPPPHAPTVHLYCYTAAPLEAAAAGATVVAASALGETAIPLNSSRRSSSSRRRSHIDRALFPPHNPRFCHCSPPPCGRQRPTPSLQTLSTTTLQQQPALRALWLSRWGEPRQSIVPFHSVCSISKSAVPLKDRPTCMTSLCMYQRRVRLRRCVTPAWRGTYLVGLWDPSRQKQRGQLLCRSGWPVGCSNHRQWVLSPVWPTTASYSPAWLTFLPIIPLSTSPNSTINTYLSVYCLNIYMPTHWVSMEVK